VDEVVRKRFHEVENYVHRLEARCLVAEQDIEVLAKDVEHAASSDLVDLKFELLRGEIKAVVSNLGRVEKSFYGLMVLIIVAVVGAMVKGVLK
jgi:hypothetical protein